MKAPSAAADPDRDVNDADSDNESQCSSLVFEYSLTPLDHEQDTHEPDAKLSVPTDKNNNFSERNQKDQGGSAFHPVCDSTDPSTVEEDIIEPSKINQDNFRLDIDAKIGRLDSESGSNPSDMSKKTPTFTMDVADRPVIWMWDGVTGAGAQPARVWQGSRGDAGSKSSESGTEASGQTVDEGHQNAIYQVSVLHASLCSCLTSVWWFAYLGSLLHTFHGLPSGSTNTRVHTLLLESLWSERIHRSSSR